MTSESPSTPERYSMRLRSVCRQFGCNLDSDSADSSPGSFLRQSGKALPNSKSLYHNHHHHHHNGLHHEVKTSQSFRQLQMSTRSHSKEFLNKYQVTPSKREISSHNHISRSPADIASDERAYLLNSSKRSYSDYSSGYEDSDFELKEKTDYTYAKSGSYSSRVTPSRSCESPNMSRTRLTRSHHSLNHSSSSEDDFMLHGKGPLSRNVDSHKNFESSDYSLTDSLHQHTKALKNTKHGGYSTVINHSYGLDSECSEAEEEFYTTQSHLYFESSRFLSRFMSSVQRFFVIRWLSTFTRWLWYTSWSSLYKVMCHVLLLDTWLLSRSSRLIRKKRVCFLVFPLFLPLLFLLGNSLFNSGNSSVATSLSDFSQPLATNIWTYVPSFFALWSHSNMSTDSKWKVWGSIFGQSGGGSTPSYGSFSTSENFIDSQDIHSIVRNIFKEEFSGWMDHVAKEQKAFVQKQVEDLSRQSIDMKTLQEQHLQHLTKELADLKLSIQTSSRKSNSEVETLDQKLLHSKLEHLEAKLHAMQDILLSLRNCCRNQTDYITAAERHLASLLVQIMNGTGKPDGSFAVFGDWMRSRFVNHEELRAHLNAMADHISSDMLQKTDDTAQQAVAAFVSKSLRELKSNVTANFNANGRPCASEDDVKNIVRDAIYLYDADKTGLVDYALESSGGSVINTRCAETYHTGTAQFRLFGIPFWYTSNSPRTVIQPGVQPGQCWAFRGTHGYLVIELSATIKPTAFSMEHIPKSLSPTGSIDSAPREFSVLGLKKETDLEGTLLGRYTYNADGEPLQYFAVEDPNVDYYPIMELRIHSNYGNVDYTCLYRFRVHGTRQ